MQVDTSGNEHESECESETVDHVIESDFKLILILARTDLK